MLPRREESETYRANRTSRKPNIQEKVLNSPAWTLVPGVATKRQKITPPCACHLCGLVAFLVLSIIIIALTAHYPQPTEQIRNWLGMAPPELYLNVALAVYIISEFFYILLRTGQGATRKFALKQLGFYLAFYFFFWYAGSLQQHFMLLAISGICLQLMESFRRAQGCKQNRANALD